MTLKGLYREIYEDNQISVEAWICLKSSCDFGLDDS
jgi:hypothetical protein